MARHHTEAELTTSGEIYDRLWAERERALVDAGGPVLAQDEATSTVWGMPGSVAKAGLAQAVLPLAEIGPALRNLITGQPA